MLGARFGGVGQHDGAAPRVVRAVLDELGIEPQVVDGSGLSRGDRTSPREVVAPARGDGRRRRRSPARSPSPAAPARCARGCAARRAQDRCRAKTGTLRDVSALAGYCTTTAGAHVAFAFLMNYVSPYGARTLQDRMTTALARYAP